MERRSENEGLMCCIFPSQPKYFIKLKSIIHIAAGKNNEEILTIVATVGDRDIAPDSKQNKSAKDREGKGKRGRERYEM